MFQPARCSSRTAEGGGAPSMVPALRRSTGLPQGAATRWPDRCNRCNIKSPEPAARVTTLLPRRFSNDRHVLLSAVARTRQPRGMLEGAPAAATRPAAATSEQAGANILMSRGAAGRAKPHGCLSRLKAQSAIPATMNVRSWRAPAADEGHYPVHAPARMSQRPADRAELRVSEYFHDDCFAPQHLLLFVWRNRTGARTLCCQSTTYKVANAQSRNRTP
jgi:hypothetical protein